MEFLDKMYVKEVSADCFLLRVKLLRGREAALSLGLLIGVL